MLMIHIYGVSATFNPDKLSWSSANKGVALALDTALDQDELGLPYTALRTGGVEGVALAMVRKAYGSAIEVVEQTEPPEIEDKADVDV